MIALDVLFDVVLFGLIAVGMWWSGTRSVPGEEGRDKSSQEQSEAQEPEPESASDYECGDCDGAVIQEDSYEHDGMSVEIYRCTSCDRPGAIVHHSDGSTSGSGCLAEQADQRMYLGRDCARALYRGVKWLSTGLYGRLTGLFGGLKRLFRGLADDDEHSDEQPCAESLRCDHEETRAGNIEECDDAACEKVHIEILCVECGAHLGWRDAPREEYDVILADDRFEGPMERVWEVSDPWLPVESREGLAPCILLEAQEDGGEWCVACEIFETWLEEGTFSPLAEEPGDGQEDIAADGGTRGDCDEFTTVLNRLQTEHPSECVLVHEAQTEHLTYYDESSDAVGTTALAYLQAQGFEVLDVGHEYCTATDQKQAWLECRRGGAEAGAGGEH